MAVCEIEGNVLTCDNKRPLFSIITIGYNVSGVVRDTLESICAQKADYEFEFIFVDDHSTDNTIEVVTNELRRIGNRQVHHRIISNETNLGPNSSRNVGILAATTDFMLLCDADDILDENWAQLLVEKLSSGAQFVCGRLEEFGVIGKSGQPRQMIRIENKGEATAPTCGGGNMGFTRSAYERVCGLPDDFPVLVFNRRPASEDTCFCWLMHHAGIKLVHVHDAILYYRQRRRIRSTFKQQYCFGMGAVLIDYLFITRRLKPVSVVRDLLYIVVGILFCAPLIIRDGLYDWVGRIARRLGRIDCFFRLRFDSTLEMHLDSIRSHNIKVKTKA